MSSKWNRLVCWLLGHDYKVIRTVPRAVIWMIHLNPWVATDCDCRRCGDQWRDFENWNRYPWNDSPKPL